MEVESSFELFSDTEADHSDDYFSPSDGTKDLSNSEPGPNGKSHSGCQQFISVVWAYLFPMAWL